MKLEDFWNYVDKTGECWLWTRCVGRHGYGCFSINKKTCTAHRYAYEISKGPIPPGLYVLHRCDVRRCVNPDHLFLGTHLDNIRDAQQKGRMKNIADWCQAHPGWKPNRTYPSGENHPMAKLTQTQVEEIRKRFTGRRGEMQKLADEYGVGQTTIGMIVRGQTWKDEDSQRRNSS